MTTANKFGVLLLVFSGIAIVAYLLDYSRVVKSVRGDAPSVVQGQPASTNPRPTESAVAITRRAEPAAAEVGHMLTWPDQAIVGVSREGKSKGSQPRVRQ